MPGRATRDPGTRRRGLLWMPDSPSGFRQGGLSESLAAHARFARPINRETLMAGACTNQFDTGFVALGYAKVAVLGIVQGITELMPISSTAHMRIVPALLGWQDPGSAFSAAMQLAALTAVVTYFWSDVRQLVFGSLAALGRRDFKDASLRLAVWIVI